MYAVYIQIQSEGSLNPPLNEEDTWFYLETFEDITVAEQSAKLAELRINRPSVKCIVKEIKMKMNFD